MAMSGGVDSSVAAALLKDDGHEIVGVTAVMTDEESRCCSREDVRRAGEVAGQLGFFYRVVGVQAAFKQTVLDPFAGEYMAGRTPSPCAVCNREIKFGVLMDDALKAGAVALATGHYVISEQGADGTMHLRRGVDRARDQSYFLARLTQAQLRRAIFPLGGKLKSEVVVYAEQHGLAAPNRESRELCFVTERAHGDWIDLRYLETPGPGDIEDTRGNRVGRHDGIHRYTVGQRKGLGLALGRPVFVVAIDAGRNVVVVGDRSEAMGAGLRVDRLNWISGSPPAPSFRADVQIRYNHPAAPATVLLQPEGYARIGFEESQFAVTPGQLAVLYKGDEVLGSGWICERVDSPGISVAAGQSEAG